MTTEEQRIKHRGEQKRWRLNNPESFKDSLRRWRIKNPRKSLLYRRTFKGYFCETYSRMLRRCAGGDERYLGFQVMTRPDWMQFLQDTNTIRFFLFQAWEQSGYALRMAPSIDRINSKQGYVVGNCRWMPQWENSRLAGQNGTGTKKNRYVGAAGKGASE